jgi:hypothetical protein
MYTTDAAQLKKRKLAEKGRASRLISGNISL